MLGLGIISLASDLMQHMQGTSPLKHLGASSMPSKASALSHGLGPYSLTQSQPAANPSARAVLLSTTLTSVTYETSSLLGRNHIAC